LPLLQTLAAASVVKKEPFLYVISFVMDGCFALVGLCVPLLAMRIGATYDELGAISAIGAGAYSLGCFLSGRLADRMGYRRFMSISSLAIALIFSCYLVVSQVRHLFVLAFLTGVALSGFWPSLQAWLGQGKERRSLLRAVGGFNVAWSLGFLVGPALGGALYAIDPAGVFALAAALVGFLFLSVSLIQVRKEESAAEERAEPASFAAARRFLPIAWTANFATFFTTGTVRSLFPKFATDLGIAPGPLGQLMSLIGLAQVIAFLLISRTDRWQFRLSPFVAFQLLAVAGLWTLAFGTSYGPFAVGLLVHGLLVGLTFTASIFYSLHARGPGGRRTGIHEGIVGSGFLLGPLAGGLAAEHIGPRAPYLLSAGVIFCAAVLQIYLLKKRNASRQ